MPKSDVWLFILARTSADKGSNGLGSGNGGWDGDGASATPEGSSYFPWAPGAPQFCPPPLLYKKEDPDA